MRQSVRVLLLIIETGIRTVGLQRRAETTVLPKHPRWNMNWIYMERSVCLPPEKTDHTIWTALTTQIFITEWDLVNVAILQPLLLHIVNCTER